MRPAPRPFPDPGAEAAVRSRCAPGGREGLLPGLPASAEEPVAVPSPRSWEAFVIVVFEAPRLTYGNDRPALLAEHPHNTL